MRELPRSLAIALERNGRDLTILVLRLGAMGDILRTLPAVRLLRSAAPAARIFWILENKWSAVLEGHPDLDGLLPMPRGEWERWVGQPGAWPRLLRSVAGFRRSLRETGAGLLLDFHGNLRSGLTSWISGAPVRLGYRGHQQKEGNRRFNTHHVASGSRRTPRMERNLDLLRALGVDSGPLPGCDLPMARKGETAARALRERLPEPNARLAIVSPGASARQAYKKPPSSLLLAACSRSRARGLLPLVVHGPGELEDAGRVVEASAGEAVLAPPTDLPTLAALISEAALFVGGDSGPLHLACAVGCPVLALYGPTDPRVNSPWGVPHRALFPPDRGYTGIKREDRLHGFEGLRPESVAQAVDELLGPRLA